MDMKYEEQLREETLYAIANKMALAARTAPKGKGKDNLVAAVAGRETIKKISDKIKSINEEQGLPGFFLRDADNILSAPVMLLLGTKIKPLRLDPCGLCGFENCDEKEKYPNHPCAFNTGDLGIAVGSAVSIATDNRVDNRIMYTVGIAALRLGLFDDEVKIIYGIPLSSTGKNPFFDRK
jgi:uncharacterized ferredoxin-like protein